MTDEPPDPDFACWTCEDYGWVYLYDPSTDAITGTLSCPDLGNPAKHAPATSIPLAVVTTALGHLPGCDGACGYRDGCPPF